MTSFTERARSGGFILSEAPGSLSRDNGVLASGNACQAGEILMADAGKLVPWDGEGDVSGILLAWTDATNTDTPVAYLARMAEVNSELLTYPDDVDEADAIAALAVIGIDVRSANIGAGGGGGGGEEEDDMTTVTVSVSSAELLALFSSPKVLVAAPGAGKMIVLNDYVVDYEFGTTAYTGAGDNGVFRTEILFDGSSIAAGDDSAALRRMFAQTESQVAFGPNDLFASNIHMNRTAAENKALVLAGEGDYADGDGVAAVTVRYTIIDLL